MRKFLIFLVLLLAFSLGGCGEGEEAGAANIPVPSLAELAGRYEDGAFTFEKVFFSEELLAEAQKKADDAAANADEDDPFDQIDVIGAGCDIEMMRLLMSYEGQTMPKPFTISALSETEGTLQFDADEEDEEDVELPEVLVFSYSPDSGALTFTEVPEGVKLANSLYASYLEVKKAKVSGTVRLTEAEGSESDFYIDLTITGTKPLDGQ